ncbi:MAG: glycosyltransferase family 4 protein [Chloroflexi bacterium]|nr:glycosyltransferase family 4 protein [Chloroflexota bacterium]
MSRILIVGQSYITAESRKKLTHLASYHLDVALVVPTTWEHDSFGSYTFQPMSQDARIAIYAIPVRNNGRVFAFSYALAPLWRAIRKIQPDIFHVEQEPGSLSLLQFVVLRRLRPRAKLFAFTWENLFYRPSQPRRFLERIELAELDYLFAGSSGAAQVYRQKGYRGPLQVLPNVGIDPHHFAPHPADELRRALGLTNRFVVGYVGRLVSEKGCEDLLNAFAQLPQSCHLLFVGSGVLRDEIARRAAERRIETRVTFQPTVPHDHVADFLNVMDCLVLPSRTLPNKWSEQFGLVLAQAMACGVPVVGSDSGAIPEVIADAGLIFPEGDVNALRDCLARLRDDPGLRAELSAKGRARVLAHYTHEHIAEQTYAIYKELLAHK